MKALTRKDISIETEVGIFFYAYISCITSEGIYYNDNFMAADKDLLTTITDGKMNYEKIKLSTSQETLNKLIDNSVDSPIQAYIDNKLEEAFKISDNNLNNIYTQMQNTANEAKTTVAKLTETEEGVAKSLASILRKLTRSYETINSQVTSYNWNALDNMKERSENALSEFDAVTAKLKTLFK